MKTVLAHLSEKIASARLPETLAPIAKACLEAADNREPALLLAKALFQTGNRADAAVLLEKLAVAWPESDETAYLLAGTLYSLSDYKGGRAVAGRRLERGGNLSPSLGAQLTILHDRAGANLGLAQQESADPDFAGYKANIARLRALGPVTLSPAGAGETGSLEDWQSEILRAFVYATEAEKGSGKSAHWDRFRADFIRVIRTAELWPHFRAYGLSYGLDDDLTMFDRSSAFLPVNCDGRAEVATVAPFALARLYERASGTLNDVLAAMPEARVIQLSETRVGDPVSFTSDRLPVPFNFHDTGCIYYADRIARHVPDRAAPRILEIGGGYGAMAAKLKRLFPDARLTLVDLPESRALQQYYLRQCFPGALILTGAAIASDPDLLESDWDFLLLATTECDLAEALRFDMAINVRSFMEMEIPTIRGYMRWFERSLTPGGILYHANRLEKIVGGERIRHEEYGVPADWELLSEMPIPIQRHIQEFVYRAS